MDKLKHSVIKQSTHVMTQPQRGASFAPASRRRSLADTPKALTARAAYAIPRHILRV